LNLPLRTMIDFDLRREVAGRHPNVARPRSPPKRYLKLS
jgi:hypothetical protein